jgi:hypothetical protein
MFSRLKGARPSPALVISLVALFVSLGGVGYAAVTITGKNVKNSSLTGKDIKNSSLTGSDVKNSSLTGSDIKNNKLTGSDVLESSLGKVPSASNAGTANTANTANSATSATSAGNANTVGGNTIRSFGLIAPSSASDRQILSLDGLQINASCTSGDVAAAAHTTTSDSEVSAISEDAAGLADQSIRSFDDTFDAGDSFALPNAHTDEIGQLRFSGANGKFVDVTYNEEDSVGGNDCYFHGFATGN